MEAYDCLRVYTLGRTFCLSPLTSNDTSVKKNLESKRGWVIRIPLKSKKADKEGSTARIDPSPVEKDEENKKEPWDLRPKKDAPPWYRIPEKNAADQTKSKKEIPERTINFPVTLSKEEIEEDLAFLTGGKRLRKMQKTPRSVRQRNDDLFPGAHLVSITIKSYEVHQ